MKVKGRIKPHQASLIWAAVATLVGFLVPVISQALLPLQYLDTHLHEMCHAIVALVTGAEVQAIYVHANGSGETPVRGGIILFIASAGYVGASIVGAAMVYFGRSEKGATRTIWTVAAALALSMLIWVRGDTVGVISGIGWVLILGTIGLIMKGRMLIFWTQFLGMQQCLNAVRAVFTLVTITTSTEVHSDATILDKATHIPSIFWALGWAGFSLLLVGLSLQRSWTTSARA